jgi:hypothetical protein
VDALGTLGADSQKLTVNVHVNRSRVDARKVSGEDVLRLVAIEVDWHESRSGTELEEVAGEAIQLAERIERHSHNENSPFVMVSPCGSSRKKYNAAKTRDQVRNLKKY